VVKVQEIISAVQSYHPKPDIELIRKAFSFVRLHHEGQTRASGEPYITHVAEVAYLTTKLQLDVPSIVTALLHDTVEDTGVTLEELEKEFGKDVAELVDGVTKLSQINFSSRAEEQAENFRKMLLAMARDIRVLLVKLCDRTHNMRTLEFLSEARRQRIAQETMDIYAPLAHRLGIYWMKSELEDLSFRYTKAEFYEEIKTLVNKNRKERERYIEDVCKLLSRELEQNGISGKVSGRPKHFYSIYQKMERYGVNFDDIHDLIAFRILVPTLMDCYGALGAMHAAWKPIPGRFKDYIAMPKPNRYQSLHTTLIGPEGYRIEVQIRTSEMHEVAERGIAAHWVYKEQGDSKHAKATGDDAQFAWLKELVESGKMLRDPVEFMSIVKEDLFPKEVYVFSPRGDVLALSAGSTPVDFAFAIHSQVGEHCTGARVNGQQVPLSHKLRNGDTIEIVTNLSQSPNRDWLAFVATTKAKQRIRAFLKGEERDRSVSIGKELLAKDLRKVKINYDKAVKDGSLAKVATDLSLKDLDSLLADVGYGKVTTTQVVAKLLPNEKDLEARLKEEDSFLQKIFQRAAKTKKERAGIKISGMEDMVFRFAKCCDPLPGDELVGYVTRGRGVAIHRRGCPEALSLDTQRLVQVSWEDNVKTLRRIRVRVFTIDKLGMLASITQSVAQTGANIVSANVSVGSDYKAVTALDLTVDSKAQFEEMKRGLEKINGVLRVERDMRKEDLDGL
jgi:guanosine-3',5'-bis(diphosphate) 3'-pyrophosphohydrolase